MKKFFFLLLSGLLLFMSSQSLISGTADDNSVPSGTESIKVKCPGKVSVLIETVKPTLFFQYHYYSVQAQAEIVAVKSPVNGVLSEIKVSEGSLVDADQELAVLNAGMNEAIKKMTAEAEKMKKILTDRQNWKVKNEKAIQSAAKNYQKTLDLLNEKKALTNQVIKAPVAGTVHLLATAGSEAAAGAVLMEISNPRQMVFQISPADAAQGSLVVGDTLAGTTDGFAGDVSAEVIAVSEAQALLKVNNDQNRVKEGANFTFKKLKAEHADAIVIPTLAMQKDSLGDFVYVVEKNKAKKLYITLGAATGDKSMILNGLAADAPLIVSGLECLANGKKITVVNPTELANEKAAAEAKLLKMQATAAAKQEAEAKKEKEKQEKQAAEKAAAEAKLQKKQAEAAAKKEAEAIKEKEKLEKQAAKKAAAEAKLQKKQAEAAAKKEAEALKEKEKLEKQAANKPGAEPAAAAKTGEIKKETALNAGKSECPKRVTVLAEVIKPEAFLEYRYHSTPLAPEVLEIKSIAAGQVAVVKVSEGSLVEKGQELVLFFSGLNEEIVKLQQDAARKKKVLAARRDAKTAIEKSIRAAESDYQNALALLEQKTALYAQTIVAPVAGTVRNVKVVVGDKIADASVLLEIVTEDFLLTKLPLDMADSSEGQIIGKIAGLEGDWVARISGLNGTQLTLRLDNGSRAIKAGSIFTVRKLKTAHSNVVVVPAAAILQDNLGYYVYVSEKKKSKKIYVGIGPREAGKVLVTQGLAQDMILILSGYECLADGKKISMVSPEDLDRERALAVGIERPAGEEKPPAGLFGERLRFAVHGTYYLMLNQNFKDTYVGLSGFGASIAFQFARKMDFWVSGGMAAKNNTPAWSPEELQLRVIPLSAALRYYFLQNGKISAFAGAGANVFMVKDLNPIADIKTTMIGFNALAGGYYKLSRKMFAQLYVKFNLVQKDVVPDSDLDTPMNLSGLELNLGFGILL